MKAITEYTDKEIDEMSSKWHELRNKTNSIPSDELFDNYTQTSGYAHYKFSGDITDKLVEALGHEPSPDEIIMLVDGGFSHFGASCTINDRHFGGRVNID